MFQRVMKVMFVIGMFSTGACAVDAQGSEPETAVKESFSEVPSPTDSLWVFEKKGFLESWDQVCKQLEGLEIRTDVGGCVYSTTYTDCHRGAISGTCHCTQTVTRSGNCG